MDSLDKLRNMPNIDKLCVAHSHELTEKAMVLDAKLKIEETINVRLRKDRRTLEVFKVRIEFILTKA